MQAGRRSLTHLKHRASCLVASIRFGKTETLTFFSLLHDGTEQDFRSYIWVESRDTWSTVSVCSKLRFILPTVPSLLRLDLNAYMPASETARALLRLY